MTEKRRRALGRPRRARVSHRASRAPPGPRTLLFRLGSDLRAPAPGLLDRNAQRGGAVITGEHARVVWQPADVHTGSRPPLVADHTRLTPALLDGEAPRIECRCGTGHDVPPNFSAPFGL